MSYYREIVIETYEPYGEASSEKVRARPIPNQNLSTNLKVQCSSKMREGHPVGTKFRVKAKITDREGTPFLSSHHSWPYQILSTEEANDFINKNNEQNT